MKLAARKKSSLAWRSIVSPCLIMMEADGGETSPVTNYQRSHPPNGIPKELATKHYKDSPTHPPVTQQPSSGGNIHGSTASIPPFTADESFAADLNLDRHLPGNNSGHIVSNSYNKNTYYVLPSTAYPPGTFHPDNWPLATSPTSIKDDVPLPYRDGNSTTANSYVTHNKQYGETAHSYLIHPQQLEFHVKEPVMVADEPSDRARRRRACLQHLADLTGHSSKPVPAGAETQPYRRSTAVSSGQRGSKEPVIVHDEGPYYSARRRRAYLQHLYDVTDRSGKPMPAGARIQPHERSRSIS